MSKCTRNTFGAKKSRRGRTFTGCYNCRARKVKCNEARPECGPCQKRGITCSGYESHLVWVTSDQKSYKPNRRRFLQCENTWEDESILSEGELDYFVALCDTAHYLRDFTVEWGSESKIPFGAFPSRNHISPLSPPLNLLSRGLIYGTPLRDIEAFLFQHYVKHVAYIMMPYRDSRNPWQSSYPAVALYHISKHRRSLCMALFAQAAFNLAHLGCQRETMLELGTYYYASAMRDLRLSLHEQRNDYGTFVACIMTLMFVEVYSGNSRSWRTHFDGAWKLFVDQQSLVPWRTSVFAESTTQSLCLIKIISETSRIDQKLDIFNHTAMLDQTRFLSSISCSSLFGFTIGANSRLISCIADINRLRYERNHGEATRCIDDKYRELLVRLDQCREVSSNSTSFQPVGDGFEKGNLSFYHSNAFVAATYIYLHQALTDSPPIHTVNYVKEVFHNIRAFFSLGDGNFSLWPAFIASTAAYEPADVETARQWLQNASEKGIGNRVEVQAIIEEVWKRREAESLETGDDLGSIIIDWRYVMLDLGFDIPLV